MARAIDVERFKKELDIDVSGYLTNCMTSGSFIYCRVMKILSEQPTIEAEPVNRGKWIEGAEDFSNGNYNAECSKCGNMIKWNGSSDEWNFCPNCGAIMDGE